MFLLPRYTDFNDTLPYTCISLDITDINYKSKNKIPPWLKLKYSVGHIGIWSLKKKESCWYKYFESLMYWADKTKKALLKLREAKRKGHI